MTRKELKDRQSWTLKHKIDHSLGTIDQFLNRLDNKAYVSFSGGKDSTVLLHLCRIIKPDIKAVFCNTGNEYPDIVKFVRATENCEIIYPKLKPAEIFDRYGFPLISKEQSMAIRQIKTTKSEKLRNYRIYGGKNGQTPGTLSSKWMPIVGKKYLASEKCCEKLKKYPFHSYEKKTGLRPILGIMADESALRQSNYLRNGGCNVFSDEPEKTKSMPLSIWNESDIWDYIADRKLKIADIYHKGAKRTGCMFCGYGCQYAGDNRLRMVMDMYPKMYDKFMNYTNNGITYREALRDVLSINGLYLPDEEPANLFTGFDDVL